MLTSQDSSVVERRFETPEASRSMRLLGATGRESRKGVGTNAGSVVDLADEAFRTRGVCSVDVAERSKAPDS